VIAYETSLGPSRSIFQGRNCSSARDTKNGGGHGRRGFDGTSAIRSGDERPLRRNFVRFFGTRTIYVHDLKKFLYPNARRYVYCNQPHVRYGRRTACRTVDGKRRVFFRNPTRTNTSRVNASRRVRHFFQTKPLIEFSSTLVYYAARPHARNAINRRHEIAKV